MRVRLGDSASELARKGRPWFYQDDLTFVPDAPPKDGLVDVMDADGKILGLGIHAPMSRLCLRLAGPWLDDGVPDRVAFYQQRIAAAAARRGALAQEPAGGVRIVHGDADGCPGLVVDRYATVAVLQVTTTPVEASLDAIVPAILEACPGVTAVLARNDVAMRRFEDLPDEVRWLHGRPTEEVEIDEDGIKHRVAVVEGHKTGFYLDQRPARRRVRELASGARVLDLFAYQGGFSLAALAGGASECLAVDESAPALARATNGAFANGLKGLETAEANVFALLRDLRRDGRAFDLIVVDPPAFAKSRREVRGAVRGYRDLNRLALRVLAPGGHLVTCSCSHHVSAHGFEDVVRQGAAGLPFRMEIKGRIGAGEDHPVWLSHPESEYLKVVHLQRTDLIPPQPG